MNSSLKLLNSPDTSIKTLSHETSAKIIPSILFILTLLISSCATPSYRQVFKEKPIYNSKVYSFPKNILYETAIKVMCSRRFIIEEESLDNGFILAKRSFQKGKRTTILALQVKITSFHNNESTLYLNAVETTERLYVADRTRFFMFIIPLPGGGGKEAASVKEGEEIIEDAKFYQNFFSEIDKELGALRKEGLRIEEFLRLEEEAGPKENLNTEEDLELQDESEGAVSQEERAEEDDAVDVEPEQDLELEREPVGP